MMHSNLRGRPKLYDRDKALDRITQVFWKHGFAATSLDMIAAASGMKRPSLYAAFGDKRAMFLLTQTRFVENLSSELSEILEQPETPNLALHNFFEHLITTYADNAIQQAGCFVFSVGLVEAATDKEIGALVKHAFLRMQMDIQSVLDRAVASGQLPRVGDTALTSELLVALGHSLSVRARSGAKPTDLRRLARSAVEHLLS